MQIRDDDNIPFIPLLLSQVALGTQGVTRQ